MASKPPPVEPASSRAVAVLEHRRLVIVALLLVTALVGAGALVGDGGGGLEIATFGVESDAHAAEERLSERFVRNDRPVTQVVVHDGGSETAQTNTLSKDILLETLTLQQAIREDEAIAEQQTVGVANAIAISTDPRLAFDGGGSLEAKSRTLADRSDDQLERGVGFALEDESFVPAGQPPVSSLLPRGFEAGDRPVGHLVVVVHEEGATDEEVLESQRTIESAADTHVESAETFVVGEQLVVERSSAAPGDSFRVVGPLVLIIVVGLLAVAYRDPVDVALSCFGILTVLVWLAGIVGWLGLSVTQLLIAVPCLLVGLSIDYSLHTTMRYREVSASRPDLDPTPAMGLALGSVLVAIGATTLTTAVGFLAGLSSPIAILREFGLVAALGILAAFVVFGIVIPTCKLEVESWRSNRRRMPPASVGSIDLLARPLAACGRVAAGAPVVVLTLAFLLATGGLLGVATIETTTDRSDFLPEERPGWMAHLPEEIRPAEYGLREQAQFVETTFEGPEEPTVEILIEGNVTDDSVTESLLAADSRAAEGELSSGDDDSTVWGPLETIETVATENESVERVVEDHDTTGDGVPDRDLETVFDAVYAADSTAASETISTAEGDASGDREYDALRLTITVDEGVEGTTLKTESHEVAAVLEANPALSATATGESIRAAIESRAILETAVLTFGLALAVIATLLTVLFRVRHRSWSLGLIAIAPVVCALAWLIGTLAVFSVPITAETALIAAIAIGLGTDYTVHLTERFASERRRATRREALTRTLTETGGAVGASAVTTAAGFGVLGLTLVPSLQRFGLVTALVVSYAVLASVLVLPALLVLWDRQRSEIPD